MRITIEQKTVEAIPRGTSAVLSRDVDGVGFEASEPEGGQELIDRSNVLGGFSRKVGEGLDPRIGTTPIGRLLAVVGVRRIGKVDANAGLVEETRELTS